MEALPSPLELAEALEPFARAARHIIHDDKPRWNPDGWMEDQKSLTVGDFRRAASALAAIRQEGVSSYPVVERSARSVEGPTDLDISSRITNAAYDAWKDETEPFEYEGRQLSRITVDRGNLRYAFSMGAHWQAGFAWARRADMPEPINRAPSTDRAAPSEAARSVEEAKALRLLLTDLKVASAVVEADWATAEFGEKFSDSPAYAHWNACIDAASGYLAKDGPAPINEAAPPTDRAGPSATDYDPIPSDRLAAPGWRPSREQIAEAIRPAWDKMTEPGTTYFDDLVRTCADAIFALKPPPPTDEMR